MERKNINRGFKKLRVWQDAIEQIHLIKSLRKKMDENDWEDSF